MLLQLVTYGDLDEFLLEITINFKKLLLMSRDLL